MPKKSRSVGAEKILKGLGGILVPGGFGERGIEGKIMAAQYARENKVPYLGLCLGMQIATIEFARNVLKLAKAHSTEFDPDTPHPVIALLDEQKRVTKKGGTMRLGAQPCQLVVGTRDPAALRRFRCQRTPSAPLRIQQRLSRTIRKGGVRFQRHHAGRQAGRDDRAQGSSLFHRQPVSSRSFRANRTSRIRSSKALSRRRTRRFITSRCDPCGS